MAEDKSTPQQRRKQENNCSTDTITAHLRTSPSPLNAIPLIRDSSAPIEDQVRGMRAFAFRNAKATGMSDEDALEEAAFYAKTQHDILVGGSDIVQQPKVKSTSSSSRPIKIDGTSVTDTCSLLRPEQALMVDRFVMDVTSMSKDDALYADFRNMTHQFVGMLLAKETSARSDASAAVSKNDGKSRARVRKELVSRADVNWSSRSRCPKALTEWLDIDSDEETDKEEARVVAEYKADMKGPGATSTR